MIEAGDIVFSADGRILSAVKRAGLFERLQLRTLFFKLLKYCMYLIVNDSLPHRSNQQCWGTVCIGRPAPQAVPCHCWFESLLAAHWLAVSFYYGAKFPDFQNIDTKA